MTGGQNGRPSRRTVLKAMGGVVAGITALRSRGTARAQEPTAAVGLRSRESIAESPSSREAVLAEYGTSPGLQKIEADPDAGFQSPYFLHTPTTPDVAEASVNASRERPLLVQLGRRSFRGASVSERVTSARETITKGLMRGLGQRTNSPVLVAPLPFDIDRFGLREDVEFTDPVDKRVDRQLVAMIEDAKSRLNGETYTVADRIHFHGFSANGYFAETFAALHPDQVRAFSAGGNGIAFLPIGELTDDIPIHGDPSQDAVPWYLGTADYEQLVGKPFDKETWMSIDKFRFIGADDQDRENTRRYTHKAYKGSGEVDQLIRDIFGRYQVDHRFETSREIYDHLGVSATFRAYEGVGHRITREVAEDLIAYHRQTLAEGFELIHLVPRTNGNAFTVGETMSVTVSATNATGIEASTTVEFGIDGTTVETAEMTLPPSSEDTIEFTRTFDQPGTYTVTVNGQQVGDGPVDVTDPSSTATPTATATTTQESESTTATQESGSTSADTTGTTTTGGAGPGFGVGAALAGIAGLSYALRHRDDD